MRVSRLTIDDYDKATSFWKETVGIGIACVESRERMTSFLKRNPNLSFKLSDSDAIVGTVLCGHDGTRGYLHHLALAASYRGQGMGQRMVDKSLGELRRLGISKCHFFIDSHNGEGDELWKTLNWSEQREVKVYSHDIELPAE